MMKPGGNFIDIPRLVFELRSDIITKFLQFDVNVFRRNPNIFLGLPKLSRPAPCIPEHALV